MTQVPSIRLKPTDTAFLNTQSFNDGVIFYDSSKNTLVLMDGRTRGGFELLRADLSNISSGNLNFGSASITATSFIGDGSQLTNLPIPANIATQTYVNTAVTTAFNTKATTLTLGTVRVDGTTILIDSNGVISSVGGGGGGGGVDLTAFSIAAEPSPSGNGSLTYNNTNGVFTYTPPDLSIFLTSYTETDTLQSVTSRGAVTTAAITINNSLDTDSLVVSGLSSLDDVTAVDVTISGTLYTKNIINTGTGVPRWTSGSDFIIDAAGDINVVGSKITNLATPLQSSDAANKAYVDSAASAFQGGTVSGAINITNTTQSTNKDTGALIVNGGVGVENDIYAGGIIYVFDALSSTYSPVLTSASGGYNGGIISGTVFINNSTNGTTTTTGNALRVLGSVGIQGNLNVGPDAFFNGIRFGRGAASALGSNTNVAVGGGTGNDAPLAVNVSGLRNIAVGYKTLAGITSSTDNVAVGYNAGALRTGGNSNVIVGAEALTAGSGGSNTAVGAGALGLSLGDTSTALGHDALRNSDGSGNIGIGYLSGHALLTGNSNVIIGSNDGATIDGTSNNVIISDGAGIIVIQSDATGKVTIPSNLPSSSSTSGALVITGGVGIGGAINTAGKITVSANDAASSTSTGSIVTLGGIGAAGDIYAAAFYGDGANLTNITATGFAGGTVAGLTSFTFSGTGSAATSTTTGAVRVTGGIGVQGRVHAGNFNGVVVPTAATAPGANAFVRTDGSGYTYTNYINSNTAANENPVVSQIVVTNASDNFYRKSSIANLATYLQPSMRSSFFWTGGGTITVNASAYVIWSSRMIVINQGNGTTSATVGYWDITCPTSGTITGAGGATNSTATVNGILVPAFHTLYYILPIGSNQSSLAANFRLVNYTTAIEIPYNWIPICQRNGDDGVFTFQNGIQLEPGQSIASIHATQTRQFDSLGVGTAPSGTAGEIRATNEITAYFSSDRNLKENIVPIENALGKLRQITGVMFDWTDEEIANRGGEDGYFVRKHDTGIIAQDVEPVLPEVVATRTDGYKAVKYEKLAGLIIQAINELADQVDEIKKKLN